MPCNPYWVSYNRQTKERIIGYWGEICELDVRLWTQPVKTEWKDMVDLHVLAHMNIHIWLSTPPALLAQLIVHNYKHCSFPRLVSITCFNDLMGLYIGNAGGAK